MLFQKILFVFTLMGSLFFGFGNSSVLEADVGLKRSPLQKQGVFNMQRVFEESKKGQFIRLKMQNEAQEKQKDLISKKTEIEKLDKEFREKKVLLSPEAAQRMQQKLQQNFLFWKIN